MKKHLLFNQSFGTEASPNQTGETLTRENRIGLMSYLRRTLMLLFAVLVMSIANIGTAWGTAPATSADTPGASGTVTFSEWTSLTKEQNYWKDGIKFWPYANLTSISNGTFTTSVPVHGYNANITAGSGWGSYTMSGLTTYAYFALGVSVKSAALVEIVVDNNQNNDLTLTRLSIKKDDVAYAADYTSSNYTTGTDIKSKATITRLDAGTGHYKISIPVTSSDLASSDPYIIKLSAAAWDEPCAFVFESVTVTTCTAPNHVDISGTNKYLGGQTISLTATAYSSEGTGSPIAAANITGYQWQKEINSVWTDVENGSGVSGATTNNLQISSCDHNNSGQYRCVVSTGATCSTNSGAYGVHVFSVYGGYVGEDWSDSEIEFSSGTTGSATVHLNAGSLYKFHIRSNDGAYYSNGVADYNGDGNADDTSDGWYVLKSVSGWSFGRSNKNFRIYAGPEGDYTITVDIANALVSGDYVTVDITYPTVTHPADGYVYFEKPNNWTNVYLYWYNDNNSRLTSWDGSPEITTTASICGTTYYYTSLGTTFGNMIFKGNGTNKWTAISTSSCGGKYLDKTTYDSPAWASFPTYTISFDGNGETSGSMSNIEDIDASTNQTITTNAFSKTGYTFANWTAEVDVKINGSTVSAGEPIANGATLQNICDNIELTAQWNVNSYALTWNLGGGTTTSAGTGIESGVSANTTSSTAYGTSLSAPTVTKTGYEFAAWDPSVAGTMPAEATTYTATWTAQHYDISYKDQGHVDFTGIHENDKPSKHTYGSETTLKTAFKDGYMFGGWFGNSSCTGSALTSLGATDYTAKVYLYAKWTAMNLDALESGTLYRVEDMVPAGVTIGASTPYYPGVSANNRFNIRGSSKLSDNATAGMCPRADVRTISGVNFTKVYGFRKPASGTDGTDLGTSLPDNHAIQFKISGDGLLDIYCYYADSIYLVKDGGSAIVLSASKSLQKVTKEVTAGTYYLYSTHVGSNQRLYGLKFTPTYTLTASATVINPMTEGKTGGITATITNSPVSGIISGTSTSTSSNTFTVGGTTVTAPAAVAGSSAECDECTYRFDSWENIPATVTADVSNIYAKYNTTYTISFKETDGTAVAGISSTYYVYGTGKAVSAYPTPTKSGCAFDGWYKENTLTNEAADIDDEAAGNVTVYAKWTHSVTFHANGGSGSMSTMKGESSSAPLTSNGFTKSGCTFYGWATSQANANAGTVAYSDGATIDMSGSNYDLYAVWKLNRPSLSCFENVVSMTVPGGSTVYYTTAASGVKPSSPTSSDTEYNSSSKPTITKDTTFAAIAILANHVSSDTAVLYCTYDDAVAISLPATLNKGNVNEVSEDMTYYNTNYLDFGPTDAPNTSRWAEWEVYVTPCQYTISEIGYCKNGHSYYLQLLNGNTQVSTFTAVDTDHWGEGDQSYTQASQWDLRGISAGVYTIRVNNSSEWGQPKLLSLTLSATVYTVTYDANGGTCGTESETVCGGSVTLPTPARAGYACTGWYTATSGGTKRGDCGGSYTLTADETLHAQWAAMPTVSGLGVDDGATLSSIPLSWKIPGICDLSAYTDPWVDGSSKISDQATNQSTTLGISNNIVTSAGYANGCGQHGVAFPISESTASITGVTAITIDCKGNNFPGTHTIWGGVVNSSTKYTYWEFDDNLHNYRPADFGDNSRRTFTIDTRYDASNWAYGGYETSTNIDYIAVFGNAGCSNAGDNSFSVREVRYHVSGREDIDHVVLMRKVGSAATDTADASATRLYSGTKSHYTDASDVTGKNYYYTVFAVHASGAVSTGVSTSLTLYTITYNAGANGTGTVPAGKKTHGIDFTLSSSTFTRGGFTQDGWSTSDGGTKVYELGGTYSVDEAIILYPHWVAVSGPVITNGNPSNGSIAITSDGSTPILSAVTGSTVYIEATPNTGYNFTSWDVYKTDESGTKVSLAGSTASTTFEMPSYAVTVNASFAAKTYTVTLNGNGGSGNTANVTATYASSSFSSSITNPTKTGYIFDGWYSGSGGSGTLIISTAGVLQSSTSYSDGSGNWTNDGNVTLYAKWSRDEKTAGWGAPWGGTAIPSNTTSTVSGVTLNACNSAKGTLWSQESYTMGDGDSITINLPTEYYISAVSTAALFDEYGGNTNKLYIQFNSQSTYTNSKYDLDDPITLGDDCYDSWKTLGSATPVSVSPIPSGAQSAKIYCSGNSASGNYLYRIIVEITAWDCTPHTVTFANGGGTGSVPLARAVCGEFTLPGSGSLSKKGNTFTGWSDGTSTYKEGDTYDVTEDVTFTALWTPFTVPAATGLAVDEDFVVTWNVPGKLDLSTASLSNDDPDYFISSQKPAESKSYDSSTEELTVTYTAGQWGQEGIALPFTGTNLETITYEYKGHRVFPAVVKSDGSTLYWEYDVVTTADSWTKVTRTPSTVYSAAGTVTPLPTAKAITFCANPNADKTDESFYIRNVFYHLQNQVDVDHVVLMRKEGSAATDTTAGGTAVRLYSGKMSHYADETVVKGKTYYYTVFSVHADGSLSAGTTQSATVPKDDLDITYAAGTASSVTHNSATLPFTMSATIGVASVTLKVYNTSDVLVKTVANVTAATSGSGNVTGLDPNTTYYFTVTPIGDATHNDGSESTKSSTFTTEKITPTKYNVTAETIGSCNEASVTIILEDSEDGVTYELYKDGSATGTTKTGTGEALNWSGITAAGEYTIWTVEDETYASVQMDNDGYTTVTVIVKDDAELAYDDNEIEKNVGDAAFTNTLTNSHSVSVTYESSDEDVATVETDGEVTIVGAGSTTITASFAGDATYCATSVSYTLTVYPVYTVTYIAMGGSCSPTSANTTTDLGKVTLPSASHDDYSSYTWVTSDGTEAGAAGDEYEPSGNISLYAKWSGSCASTCYTVTYHGNGATSGYVNDPVQYASGTTVYVSSSTGSYTRDGYEFNGWNTAANGSGTKVAYFTITGNTTLYAQWKYVINSNNTDFSGYAAAPTQYQDVKVTNGATLTITSTRTIHDLTIETGSTLNVSTTNGDGTGDGVTFTVNSLHLKGGWNSNYTKYDMPRVYIDRLSSLVKDAENPIVNFDISVDSRTYYPFAVPFRVKVSDINYADPTLAYYAQYGATGQYVIKEYDGERRAEKGPDHENNWKVVPQEDKEGNDVYLEPGRGYIMTAISLPAYGGGVIRIPLSFTNAWTALGEQGTVSAVTKNIVPVTAYTGKATEGDKFANKGWNLLGVPFMSCYTTSDDMGTSVVMQGKFNFETGEWDGEDKVRYVNVPMHDFSEYVQVDMEDEKTPTVLRPGWCFFVQIGTTGNLTFLTADQAASSSLPIYAPKREKANMPTVKTGIILSDGEKSDQTTFLVSDKYSAMDYEINADLEKLFGNGYTLATYSLSGETRLAYNALSNADVANIIPIGYRAPAEGEYTFSINPSYAENGAFESVNLIDYETGIVTDLSQSSYTFSTERTQDDARFALNVVPRQETPTDLEDVQGDDVQGARVRKLLIEDKLFIIRDGVLYDATGKKVKGGAQ